MVRALTPSDFLRIYYAAAIVGECVRNDGGFAQEGLDPGFVVPNRDEIHLITQVKGAAVEGLSGSGDRFVSGSPLGRLAAKYVVAAGLTGSEDYIVARFGDAAALQRSAAKFSGVVPRFDPQSLPLIFEPAKGAFRYDPMRRAYELKFQKGSGEIIVEIQGLGDGRIEAAARMGDGSEVDVASLPTIKVGMSEDGRVQWSTRSGGRALGSATVKAGQQVSVRDGRDLTHILKVWHPAALKVALGRSDPPSPAASSHVGHHPAAGSQAASAPASTAQGVPAEHRTDLPPPPRGRPADPRKAPASSRGAPPAEGHGGRAEAKDTGSGGGLHPAEGRGSKRGPGERRWRRVGRWGL